MFLFSQHEGPKKKTLRDFWYMIWQENVGKVVMVTQLVENKKVPYLTIFSITYYFVRTKFKSFMELIKETVL